jgi:hypothetical protein
MADAKGLDMMAGLGGGTGGSFILDHPPPLLPGSGCFYFPLKGAYVNNQDIDTFVPLFCYNQMIWNSHVCSRNEKERKSFS